MPDTVRLKGDFDKNLEDSRKMLQELYVKLKIEGARPTFWTKRQVDDLGDLHDALGKLFLAVAAMAVQVRDD